MLKTATHLNSKSPEFPNTLIMFFFNVRLYNFIYILLKTVFNPPDMSLLLAPCLVPSSCGHASK